MSKSGGNPTGAWKINYPDGTPRRQYEYNRPGIAKWTICRYKHKLAEVSSDLFIPAEIIKSLDEFETNLFDQEKDILTSEHVAGSNGMVLSGTTSFRTDPYQAVIHVEDLMTAGKFSGTVLIWSEELTIRRKCTFINGSEYRISFFYNGKGEVTKQDEYRDDKLVRTVTFKKNGEQKVKEYTP